ncbi:Inositol 1,4,5-triphosphate kinase 1 [Aphelenchoides fujianensis]|nr:Inositol 1,4,5-triphosphate kinase 1 [Aphelenchoides fujianensis]
MRCNRTRPPTPTSGSRPQKRRRPFRPPPPAAPAAPPEVLIKPGSRRTGSPSMVAAVVAGGWKHDSVKRDRLGPTPSNDSAAAFSTSDDSLVEDRRHFEGYHLSEQSHEVLQQIIRCFPFPSPRNSPRPAAKKSLTRTMSNDPTAIRGPHPPAEQPQTPGGFSVSSHNPFNWQTKKKRFGHLLNRMRSHEAPEGAGLGTSASATTLCTDEKEGRGRGALGRLCQRSKPPPAAHHSAFILEQPHKRPATPPLIHLSRFVRGEKLLSSALLNALKDSQRVQKRANVVVPQRDPHAFNGERENADTQPVERSPFCCACLIPRRSRPPVRESPPTPMTPDSQRRESIPFRRVLQSGLLQITVDTMAVTSLPLDCWLKDRLKHWVQLSGHEGTIIPATNHTLWKKQPAGNTNEARAYSEIMADDALRGLTPKYFREIEHNGDSFIEIQDLLSQFVKPECRAVMDIKLGFRTFLESEVSNGSKRKDLFKKMMEIDPTEPTEEERKDEAITKLRYMQFRERESSTATLGFRIEAAQCPGGKLRKSFQKKQLAARLREMRLGIEMSEFFRTHEVVGSSILIVFDDVRTNAWMIDFAKSIRVPEGLTLTHRRPWEMGNHEDGYLNGIDNLIEILER